MISQKYIRSAVIATQHLEPTGLISFTCYLFAVNSNNLKNLYVFDFLYSTGMVKTVLLQNNF